MNIFSIRITEERLYSTSINGKLHVGYTGDYTLPIRNQNNTVIGTVGMYCLILFLLFTVEGVIIVTGGTDLYISTRRYRNNKVIYDNYTKV